MKKLEVVFRSDRKQSEVGQIIFCRSARLCVDSLIETIYSK